MSATAVMMLLAWTGALLGPFLGLLVWRRRGRGPRRSAARLAALALAYGLGVWAFLIEPRLLVVRHVAVTSVAWRGPPLRIGVVSDTHVGEAHVTPLRVRRTMARLSRERPEVVVFLGDYVGGHEPAAARSPEQRAAISRGIANLAEAAAPLGRAAVLGNHDWWYDGPTVEAALRQAGIPALENQAIRVDRPGGAFWIAGVADLHSTRARASPTLALRDVPADAPVILLTHWPDPFAEVPARVALTLAGHSHCGQVNLPLVGRPILPSAGSRRWPCGAYQESGRQLFVTGGMGVSILPVRFRAPPEIVIVTLSERP